MGETLVWAVCVYFLIVEVIIWFFHFKEMIREIYSFNILFKYVLKFNKWLFSLKILVLLVDTNVGAFAPECDYQILWHFKFAKWLSFFFPPT